MAINQFTVFRVYDQGISDWVNNIAIINGEVVPHVIASPQRAFASMRDVLVKQGVLPPDATLDMVPLPFISITRGSPRLNLAYWSRARLRKMAFTDASKKFVNTAHFPQPLLIPYSIEVWSKYMQNDAEIFDRFMYEFASNMAYMLVHHKEPYGTTFTAIRLESVDDNSDLEGGSLEERQIRHTFNVLVEGWYFFDPSEEPSVLKISNEFFSYGGDDVGTGICPPSKPTFEENITEEIVP